MGGCDVGLVHKPHERSPNCSQNDESLQRAMRAVFLGVQDPPRRADGGPDGGEPSAKKARGRKGILAWQKRRICAAHAQRSAQDP